VRTLKIVLLPALIALVLIVFARFGMAKPEPKPEDCRDYGVRIQEDNGWTTGQRSRPARFYCDFDYSYNLVAADRGVLLCVCDRTTTPGD